MKKPKMWKPRHAAPAGKRHASKKDYNRKEIRNQIRELDEIWPEIKDSATTLKK